MDVPLKLLNIYNVIIPWIVIGVKEKSNICTANVLLVRQLFCHDLKREQSDGCAGIY